MLKYSANEEKAIAYEVQFLKGTIDELKKNIASSTYLAQCVEKRLENLMISLSKSGAPRQLVGQVDHAIDKILKGGK